MKRKGRSNDDLDLHAAAWLHYGYLQQGRYARARSLSDSLGALFAGHGSEHVSHYLSMVSVQNVVETRRPDSTRGVTPRPWEHILQAGARARPAGDSIAVATALTSYRLRADTMAKRHGRMPPAVRAFERKLAAMDARMGGRNEEAVAALTEAVALEEERSLVGPPTYPPARELLADLLLDLGRVNEAVAAYDTALQRTPLRSPVLLGRARAAVEAGDHEGAARWYALLARNWKAADADLPELAEVSRGASGAAPAPASRRAPASSPR